MNLLQSDQSLPSFLAFTNMVISKATVLKDIFFSAEQEIYVSHGKREFLRGTVAGTWH